MRKKDVDGRDKPGHDDQLICPTGNSHMAAMRKLPVVLICRRRPALPKTPNQNDHPCVLLPQEGRWPSSRTLGAGCDGRFGGARRAAPIADGEVVWSWRPDAGVKLAEQSEKRRWQKSPVTGESTK
jgi:hypothetical protein